MPPKPKNNGPIKGNQKLPEVTDRKQTAADLAADYQWSLALLNSNPELRKAFRQAIKQGWSTGRFIAEIQDTDWFQKHSSSWRQNQLQKIVDPASWNAARKGNRAAIEDTAAKMGAVLTPRQMQKFADDAMALGWNESQLQNQLGAYIKIQTQGAATGMYTGAAGQAFTAIKEAAHRNGYSIPKGKMAQWVVSISKGESTIEDYAQMMRNSAAAAFPSLREQLKAGADLDDLAAPYRQKMAALLELDPESIDLTDRSLVKGLSHKDEKGNYTTMPLYDFEDQIRKDERWRYTDNARKEVMGQVMRLGQRFGKVAG